MNILEYETTQELKTHGNSNFPFNIYPCSIPLDFTGVPLHWHNDMEIIYVKKGRGTVLADLRPYQVRAGDLVFITPGSLHGLEQYRDCTMEYENILFQLSLLMTSVNDLCSEQFFQPLLHGRLALPVLLSAEAPFYSEAVRCLDELDKLSGSNEPTRILGIKGKLFELFSLLFQNCPQAAPPRCPSKSLETIKLLFKHVETHYQEKLTISNMADLCGFSDSHFMKFFKQHMGISFIEYLNDYRLMMAARMLRASTDTIAAISEEIGFENLSYFNRLFKRKYGMTPSCYRSGAKEELLRHICT